MRPTAVLCLLLMVVVAVNGSLTAFQSFPVGSDLKCYKRQCPKGTEMCSRKVTHERSSEFVSKITCLGKNSEVLASYTEITPGNEFNDEGIVMQVGGS